MEENVHRMKHQIRTPLWHSDYVMPSHDEYCLLTEEGEPLTFQDALNSSNASQ